MAPSAPGDEGALPQALLFWGCAMQILRVRRPYKLDPYRTGWGGSCLPMSSSYPAIHVTQLQNGLVLAMQPCC